MSFLLFEAAAGFGLFERVEAEEIGEQTDQVQKAINDYGRFSKMIKLKSFLPFSDAQQALDNANDVAEGVLNETLKNFLEMNLPKSKKSGGGGFTLGVTEDKLAVAIHDELGYKCAKSALNQELLRGIRMHFTNFVKELKSGDLEKAQLGLAHSYSRAKVKFNVHKQDNMVIQAIAVLDQLDKDLNTFAMRCREWYSWHFPELGKIIADNLQFARLCQFIRNKETLSEESISGLEEIVGDRDKANEILDAARASMGTDINEFDMTNIEHFADKVVKLGEYRHKVHSYLLKKMNDVAPNLSALIGEQVGARLISHAGSLTNLAKYPASTVQILGAEKALFRALKTKSNTPKYGLIFHSSFIGRASPKNKGKISRYLANKCTIASRIDAFGETLHTNKFGEKLKEQVEERLHFYDTGVTPKKNVDVMKEVLEEVTREGLTVESTTPKKEKKKDKKKSKSAGVEEMEVEETKPESKKSKKDKKKAKEAPVEEAPVPEESGKKKKRKVEEGSKTPSKEAAKEAATPKSSEKKKKKSKKSTE